MEDVENAEKNDEEHSSSRIVEVTDYIQVYQS